MNITMFGIPNCDTIKKARKWLDSQDINYQFHDYRKQGIDTDLVNKFCQSLGWESVLNKRGTTYRQLSDEQKKSLDEKSAVALMAEMPAMIKRPILLIDESLHIGFKPDQYANIFS
ncbi:ArsC family reductase [Vibrio marisflavi]|uniref:Protein YffB n=1 Tax=Vibrio marisflavi CECT 7928 TaxID=634439 RepID=A0ABN8E4P4_9VIBR|nr:ArsC family reductase [Vibrio marisflavi]CAH0539063.1 Protein YffB [Vibrio marisflavi CECT 7928]